MRQSVPESLHIEEALPDEMQYCKLFQTTGWNEEYKLSCSELHKSIQASWATCSVYCSGNLIGFGRLISDGYLHALLVDLIVHPDFQNKGFGSIILNNLLKKCLEKNIRDVQLFSAKDKSGFYEKHGFSKRPDNAPGMDYKVVQHK